MDADGTADGRGAPGMAPVHLLFLGGIAPVMQCERSPLLVIPSAARNLSPCPDLDARPGTHQRRRETRMRTETDGSEPWFASASIRVHPSHPLPVVVDACSRLGVGDRATRPGRGLRFLAPLGMTRRERSE